MKREDINELFTIDVSDGTLIITKRDIDEWLKPRDEYDYLPDVLINPHISINRENGVLTVIGCRLSYTKIRLLDSWYWLPYPTRCLESSWKDEIFYSDDDLVYKNHVEWVKNGLFKKRVKYKNDECLKAGYYLNTNGYNDKQITNNYRIIGLDNPNIT